jgi:formate hydrogenlyase subunit 6/NADH:ubiquinone oxidoreductase subunit I
MKNITQNCTGCSACKNFCPKKAITLKGELFIVIILMYKIDFINA